MKVKSSSKLMQYHLFEQNTQDISITDNLDNEIECPRCHDVMTLFSGFDFLTISAKSVIYRCTLHLISLLNCDYELKQFNVILKAPTFQKLKNFE